MCAVLYDSSAPAARTLGPRGEGQRERFSCTFQKLRVYRPFSCLSCGVLFQTVQSVPVGVT